MSRSLVVVLDNIRSHHNVGSVFRSCDAFGVVELILCGITPQPPHRDIHKSALGATESVSWRHTDDIGLVISELKEKGYRIASIEQTTQSVILPSSSEITKEKIALIMGNEVKGVGQEALRLSDVIWEIEQAGIKKSLNVSVCAGICLHHLTSID